MSHVIAAARLPHCIYLSLAGSLGKRVASSSCRCHHQQGDTERAQRRRSTHNGHLNFSGCENNQQASGLNVPGASHGIELAGGPISVLVLFRAIG
jgi:hypothetical protein